MPKAENSEELIYRPGKLIIPKEIEKDFTPILQPGKKLFEEKKALSEMQNLKSKNQSRILTLFTSSKEKINFLKQLKSRKYAPRHNNTNSVFLCGDTSENHRWGVELDEGDFFRQAYVLKKHKKYPAIIGIRRTNFFKLDRIYNFVRKSRGLEERNLPKFNLTPFTSIKKRFYSYLDELVRISKKDNIKLMMTDRDLKHILETIETQAGKKDFKEKEMLRSLGPVFKDVFTGPRYLLFNANARCNTDCVYCRTFSPFRGKGVREKELKEMNPILELNVVTGVLEQAKDMGTEIAIFVGEGEPTTYPHFSEVIESIKKNRMQFNFSTNGMLLNRFIDKIIDGTCHTVTVSMSWASEETFKKIRPGTDKKYVKIIQENVKMLSKAKIKRNAPEIVILHAINKRNYYEIPKMAHMAAEMGANTLWLQMTHLSPYMVKELKLSEEEMQRTRELIEEARIICKSAGVNFSSFVDFELKHFDEKKGDWSKKGLLHQGCYVGWHFAYIDLNNLVSFCCGVRHIGRIDEKKSFRDIWQSDAYTRYRNDGLIMHKENPVDMFGKPLYDPFCDSCDNHDQNTYMMETIKNFKIDRFVER